MVEFTCSAGDLGSIPGFGRCPGEGHGYPLQYSCLENPMDRGAWWATAYRVRHDRDSHFHFTMPTCDLCDWEEVWCKEGGS